MYKNCQQLVFTCSMILAFYIQDEHAVAAFARALIALVER